MRRSLNPLVRTTFALLLAGIAAFSSAGSASAYDVHIVTPGETLSQIAARYGTTVARLRQLNNLSDINHVWYGQRLVVDSGNTAAAPAPGNQGVAGGDYRVRAGDSLTKIARRYDISLAQLARMNRMSPSRWLYTGQALKVPDSAPAAQSSPSQVGSAGQNAGAVQDYTVRAGDTLNILARRHGTTLRQLMSMNGMTSAGWLYVGQVVRVPGGAAVEAQPAPPAPAARVAPASAEAQPLRSDAVMHMVQPGEYLSQIAERYRVAPAVLVRVNGVRSPDLLEAGQVLRIPSPAGLELLDDAFTRLDPSQYPTQTERWVEVDLSEQLAIAYEGTTPVRAFVISSGVGNTPTVTGTFRIWAKIAMQDMRGGSRAAGNYYHLKDVRNVQYFYKNYAFHGTYWHDKFGTPMSRGCVNMTEADAAWLFEWTSPAVYGDDWLLSSNSNPGTLVMVHN